MGNNIGSFMILEKENRSILNLSTIINNKLECLNIGLKDEEKK